MRCKPAIEQPGHRTSRPTGKPPKSRQSPASSRHRPRQALQCRHLFAKRGPHDESSVPYLGVRILASRWHARLHCARAEPHDHRTAKLRSFRFRLARQHERPVASFAWPHLRKAQAHKRTRSATRRVSRAAVRFRLFNISRTAHRFSRTHHHPNCAPVIVHRARLRHLRVLRTLYHQRIARKPPRQARAAHKRRENRRLLSARKRTYRNRKKRPRQ